MSYRVEHSMNREKQGCLPLPVSYFYQPCLVNETEALRTRNLSFNIPSSDQEVQQLGTVTGTL